jgi:hypothetical protein
MTINTSFTAARLPTLAEGGDGPAAFLAYATDTDDQHVLFATSVSDRDTKYANVRKGTLVSCAELGIVWQKITTPPTAASWRVLVEFGKPLIQRGVVTIPAVAANAGASAAVAFPVAFLTPPIVALTAGSDNGYGAASTSIVTTTGFTAKYWNPTSGVPTNPKVHWIAIEA